MGKKEVIKKHRDFVMKTILEISNECEEKLYVSEEMAKRIKSVYGVDIKR